VPILRLAGKASIRCRPFNSALCNKIFIQSQVTRIGLDIAKNNPADIRFGSAVIKHWEVKKCSNTYGGAKFHIFTH